VSPDVAISLNPSKAVESMRGQTTGAQRRGGPLPVRMVERGIRSVDGGRVMRRTIVLMLENGLAAGRHARERSPLLTISVPV
jgi:hypothetical protein